MEKGDGIFRELLESAAEGVVVVDRSGRIVLVNTQAESLFGYGRHELLGREVELLIPERLRELHVRHRVRYLEQPRNRPMGAGLDLWGRRADGSEFPLEISLSHAGRDGEMLIMASIVEVSARRAMESALRESEQQCRSLIDAVLDSAAGGILILGDGFEVVCANRALEDFFGIRREELIGKDVRAVARELLVDATEPPEGVLRGIAALADDAPMEHCIELHVAGSGGRRERWLEYRAEPIRSGLFGGGCIVHFFDVTELKLAQRAVAQHMEERIQELETTLSNLEQIARPPRAETTARIAGIAPLKESAPEAFSSLVETYGRVLDLALERRIYRTEERLSDSLAGMADRLCRLKAAPRDVIDLHSATLKRKSADSPPLRMRGYLDEGHFLLVELMGYLATGYRNLGGSEHGRETEAC